MGESESRASDISHLRGELVDAVSVFKDQLGEWMQLVATTREEMGALANLHDSSRCSREVVETPNSKEIVQMEDRVTTIETKLSSVDMEPIERRLGQLESAISMFQARIPGSGQARAENMQDASTQSAASAESVQR